MVRAAASVSTKTVKIGTRGSPLALAQAYLTRQLLQVSVPAADVIHASAWKAVSTAMSSGTTPQPLVHVADAPAAAEM